jgi:hypothetical protein
VSRLAAQIEAFSDLRAIFVQAQMSAEDACLTRSCREYLRSRAVVEDLVDGARALYCARLFDGFERCQVAALLRMARRVPVVIRCPTTDDAARLRRVVDCLGVEGGSARLVAHCLNAKSVALLAGRANVACELQPNTAPPATGVESANATPLLAPRYFYCGRGAKSKNVEALAEAWDWAGGRELLELYGPGDLEQVAGSGCRVKFAGCYQGDPPFRFGDIVFLSLIPGGASECAGRSV